MKDKYKVNDLITGNVSSVSSSDLTYNASKETFIFERQKARILSSNKRKKYQEVFTELEINLESENYEENSYFANLDQSYIINEQSITHSNLLTKQEKETGFISKIRLLEIYNCLNFSREMIVSRSATPKQKVRKRKRG